MKRYCKITTNTPDETTVTGLSEPWILLDKSETGKDNFIFQRSINNLTLDLLNGYNIDDVKLFVTRDKEHALMCVKNKDNTYTVIYKKEKTELSQDYPFSIYKCCKNIILPNSITKINLETFKNCSGLENITLPNSISEIDDKVFLGCEKLTTIKIPNRVKRISDDLFNGCTNLTQVYIPSNIHDISETAFNECVNLKEVILYNGLTNSEEHFTANENGEINIPYYDENGEQKTIGININNNTKPEEWELNPLTPDNNVILYKTNSGNKYNFDDGANTSYVEGYTINDDGSHSPNTILNIVDNDEVNKIDGYGIYFPQNTNISKLIGGLSGNKQWFYFESIDLTEIYLPVSVTDINNCVFNTPKLTTLLLPPNISLKQCKLPDDEENGIYDQYVEVLFSCEKLKTILYNGTSKEFMNIISNEDTASRTWYKDLPHEFTVVCLDKDLNFENNFKSEEPIEPEKPITPLPPFVPEETTSDNDDPNGGTTSDNVGDSTSDNNDGPNIPGGSEDIGDSTSDNNDGPESGDDTGESTSDNNDNPEGGDDTGESTSDNNDGPEGDSTSDNNDGPEGGDNTGDSTSDNNDGPEGGDNTGDSTSDNNDGPEGDSTSDNNDGPEGGDDTGESTSSNNEESEDGDDTGESTSSNNEEGEDVDDTGESTSSNNDGPDSVDDTNLDEKEFNYDDIIGKEHGGIIL